MDSISRKIANAEVRVSKLKKIVKSRWKAYHSAARNNHSQRKAQFLQTKAELIREQQALDAMEVEEFNQNGFIVSDTQSITIADDTDEDVKILAPDTLEELIEQEIYDLRATKDADPAFHLS